MDKPVATGFHVKLQFLCLCVLARSFTSMVHKWEGLDASEGGEKRGACIDNCQPIRKWNRWCDILLFTNNIMTNHDFFFCVCLVLNYDYSFLSLATEQIEPKFALLPNFI